MKYLIFILFFLSLLVKFVFAQQTFDVQDFSKEYYGKVYLESPEEVFTKGWAAIYQKKTNKLLLKVESDELVSHLDSENRIKANVLELPYGEQSVIIYEDFNFDEIKDFAIMDGQNSCYHGPSFKIFLGTKDTSKFNFNKHFTKLSQNYCGMFKVIPEKRQLTTMTKSSCCWHQYSTYVIQNNKPKSVEIIEAQWDRPYSTLNIRKWNGKRMIEIQRKTLNLNSDSEKSKVLFSFRLGDKRQILLFEMYGILNYAIVNDKDHVEMGLPENINNPTTQFTLNSKTKPTEISFRNYSFEYTMYQTEIGQVGLIVKRKGIRQREFIGDPNSIKGNLNSLLQEGLENLAFN